MESWTSLYNSHTNRAPCYLLHFFPVDTVKQNVRPTFQVWTEGFTVPPALLKLTVTLEGSTIQLYHQGCIAINTRGATVYGSKRTLVRRMIMHVQYHEEPLSTLLENTVPAREATQDMDPPRRFPADAPLSRYTPAACRVLDNPQQTTTIPAPCGSAIHGAGAPSARSRAYAPPSRNRPSRKSASPSCPD